MEQNNFEKNVQQKMDEFKIAPSDSVWTNVEKRIGRKDKDRKLIFILFFLIVVLLSGGYWLLKSSTNNQKNNQQIGNVIKNKSNSKARNNVDSSFENLQTNTGNPSLRPDTAEVSAMKIRSAKADSENKVRKDKQQKNDRAFKGLISKQKEVYSKPGNNGDSLFQVNHENKQVLMIPNVLKNETENYANTQSDSSLENKINTDSVNSSELKSDKGLDKIIVKNDSAKRRISAKQKGHWNIGFTLSGGESSIETSFLERSFSSADYLSNMPSSGGIPSYYYQPSPIKNSTAFIAGVLVEKDISARGKIVFGLSYKYYSLVNKVGNKIDSILSPSRQYFSVSNSYNSFNSSFTYWNNFHYLELPVSFKLGLSKNKKLPLSWEAGVNLSRLISSNALQFKSNAGVYYNDNSLLNKMQVGFHTALAATIFSKQKLPVTFGPYFYYGATSIADKGLYSSKHFSFIGIQTEFLLRKK